MSCCVVVLLLYEDKHRAAGGAAGGKGRLKSHGLLSEKTGDRVFHVFTT